MNEQFWEGVKGPAKDMPLFVGRYAQRDSAGAVLVRYGADWRELDGVYIGATWWIRLNRPCAAVMRPFDKFFDHLLLVVKKLWHGYCLD